jgi:DNA-directed RNA polymerase I subunit RPA2
MDDVGAGSFAHESLARLVAPHVDSFNSFLLEGLQRVQESLPPLEVEHPEDGSTLSLWFEGLRISKPLLEESRATETRRELRVFPRECRQAGSSYTAPLVSRVCWRVGDGDVQSKDTRLSHFPVMVCVARRPHLRGRLCALTAAASFLLQVNSLACNLHGLDRAQLLDRGEEANEVGGYFIVNGNEKLLRLLVNQRRHYIMGMVRSAYARRGKSYTEFATAIRCVAPDETSMTVRVHYLTTGSARLAFVLRKQEFFVPVRHCATRSG